MGDNVSSDADDVSSGGDIDVTGFEGVHDTTIVGEIEFYQASIHCRLLEMERRGRPIAWELKPGKGGLPFRVVIGRALVEARGADITGDAAGLDSLGGEQQP